MNRLHGTTAACLSLIVVLAIAAVACEGTEGTADPIVVAFPTSPCDEPEPQQIDEPALDATTILTPAGDEIANSTETLTSKSGSERRAPEWFGQDPYLANLIFHAPIIVRANRVSASGSVRCIGTLGTCEVTPDYEAVVHQTFEVCEYIKGFGPEMIELAEFSWRDSSRGDIILMRDFAQARELAEWSVQELENEPAQDVILFLAGGSEYGHPPEFSILRYHVQPERPWGGATPDWIDAVFSPAETTNQYVFRFLGDDAGSLTFSEFKSRVAEVVRFFEPRQYSEDYVSCLTKGLNAMIDFRQSIKGPGIPRHNWHGTFYSEDDYHETIKRILPSPSNDDSPFDQLQSWGVIRGPAGPNADSFEIRLLEPEQMGTPRTYGLFTQGVLTAGTYSFKLTEREHEVYPCGHMYDVFPFERIHEYVLVVMNQ